MVLEKLASDPADILKFRRIEMLEAADVGTTTPEKLALPSEMIWNGCAKTSVLLNSLRAGAPFTSAAHRGPVLVRLPSPVEAFRN